MTQKALKASSKSNVWLYVVPMVMVGAISKHNTLFQNPIFVKKINEENLNFRVKIEQKKVRNVFDKIWSFGIVCFKLQSIPLVTNVSLFCKYVSILEYSSSAILMDMNGTSGPLEVCCYLNTPKIRGTHLGFNRQR